jgi:integrase
MTETKLVAQTAVTSLDVANLKKNPAALYLLSLRSATGRYQMMRKLQKVARMFGGESWQSFAWASLDSVHVNAIITKLAQDYKPSYVNTILAALRGVMEIAYDHLLIGESTYRLIKKVKRVQGGETEPTGRYIPSGERTALMEICLSDSSPAGFRDAAILVCAYPGGLRRAEIAGLNREDIIDGDALTLKVRGKGKKNRSVFMDNGGADALRDWLTLRGSEDGPLFFAGRKGGSLIEGQRITGQSVYEMLKRRAVEAGIRDLGTHDFRRTTASDLLDISDAVTCAGYLGHSSTNILKIYDRRDERARKKAAQGLHISYRQRDFVQ